LSGKIFLGLLAMIVVFSGTMLYSLFNHHRTVGELRLLNRGYLAISFSIVEMRATQRVYNVLLERVLQEPDPTQTLGGLASARRLRPMILQDLRDVVRDLSDETPSKAESAFIERVSEDLEAIALLYEQGAEDYALLSTFVEHGNMAEAETLFSGIESQETEIESILRHLQSSLVRRINRVTARAEQRERQALIMFTALILASLGLALLVTLAIRNLLAPMADLTRGVEAVGRGDLDHRIEIRRMDEIGRYAAEFNQMAAALSERDRRLRHAERLAAVGKMASHIAHEVRNPLSSVGLNAEMIGEEAATLPPGRERREILGLSRKVVDEVDRLTAITRQYLQLGRLPSPEPSPTRLGSLVESVALFMEPELSEDDVELELDLDERDPELLLDPDQFRQVLINLLRNAAQALPEEGERRVEVRLVLDEDSVHLSVVDTGRGMPETETERIFEPFYSTREGGTGLGLSLVKHVVDGHGGTVRCFSERGRGTTFVITLPAGAAGLL
jgi:signal transduction histidine kinase